MATTSTDVDVERRSWHDCTVWGLELHPTDPDEGDWTCDLALDIDFIVEWLCGVENTGPFQFRVVPATLRFHTVSGLRIAIEWGATGGLLHEMSIDRIEREAVSASPGSPARPDHRWGLVLNWPRAGEIAFDAAGFTQTLRADPAVTDRQSLARRVRGGGAAPPSAPPG